MIKIIKILCVCVCVCVCVGNVLESEGHDRSDINLPGNQLQLLQDATDLAISECDQSCLILIVVLREVLNFNESTATILVLYNAGPLDVSWAVNSKKVVAILEGYFPSQVNKFELAS